MRLPVRCYDPAKMKTCLLAALGLVLSLPTCAQQLPVAAPSQAEAAQIVARVEAYAHQYARNVPSFEVDESALSEAWDNGKLKRRVSLEMTLRQIRDPADPEESKDYYTFRLVDGKPPKRELLLPAF